MEVMYLWRQGTLMIYLKLEEARGEFFLEPLEVAGPCQTPGCQTSSLQNYEGINFCCFKPPRLQFFVTAVQGNEHILSC